MCISTMSCILYMYFTTFALEIFKYRCVVSAYKNGRIVTFPGSLTFMCDFENSALALSYIRDQRSLHWVWKMYVKIVLTTPVSHKLTITIF